MYNHLKIFSAFLLSWYGILRWILLDKSNDTSQAWLINPFGTFVALISIVYLVYFIITKCPQKSYGFIFATFILFLVNLYFLFVMSCDFIQVFNPINFGYLTLDIFILSYYGLTLSLCYMTKFNKNINENINISYV